MENIIKYLQLYFTKGFGNKTFKQLIDIFGSIGNIYNSSYNEISKIAGERISKLLLEESKKFRKLAELQLIKAEKHKTKILIYESEEFPENLKNIPDPPMLLFIKGNLPKGNHISIVGTRKHTSYGKKITEIVVKELVKNEINIVSGGAYGIDTIAHKQALKSNGKTIAVLGSGIDVPYPPSNKKLFEEISERGALISEFPFGAEASKYTFPQRNRIVAGISEATVVIEAPEKSGSLITAKLANEYGKPVFAVPHNIDNHKGRGCNLLIKDGAVPVLSEETIFEEIPYLLKSGKFNKNLKNLHEEEIKVLNSFETEIHIDRLIEITGFSFDSLNIILFNLEMEGLVKNENGLVRKLTL